MRNTKPKPKKPRGLSAKQKRFIAAYNGNATAAALEAGYSERNAGKIGNQLMSNRRITAAIQAREAERIAPAIATREERQQLFTNIMRDTERKTSDRLRACELLGKSEGDFIERQEVSLEPLHSVEIVYADALTREDGTLIDPESAPEEYAAAWLKKFFADHEERARLGDFIKNDLGNCLPKEQAAKIAEFM